MYFLCRVSLYKQHHFEHLTHITNMSLISIFENPLLSLTEPTTLQMVMGIAPIATEANAKQLMSATLGLDNLMYNEERLENSLKKPEEYVSDRKAAFKLIQDEVGAKFIEEYNRLGTTKMPEARKREIATKITENWVRTRVALVEEEFPSTFIKSAVDRKAKKDLLALSI